jgi:CRP/FNR family transcriptional regulator, anaerobic regulatory protein
MKTLPIHLQPAAHPQAEACARCPVRPVALFGALGEAALDRVHSLIASPRVDAERRVYRRGDLGGAVYTLRSGIVRFERVTEGGQRRIVRVAGRGDLIGQEALLRQPWRDDAVASTEVTLCRIPVPLIDELGSDQHELMHELMRRWQKALDDAESWSSELCAGPARRRVLKLLQRLQRHEDERGLVWLPRRDQMGDMLDMTVETASRIVSSLRREGVLQVLPPLHGRLDEARLQQALQAQEQ